MKRPRVDVNLEELDRIIERGTQAPLSESESEKLKSALHALAGMLAKPRTTEKTKNVLEQPETLAPENDSESPDKTPGHGRNGASSYSGAKRSRRSAFHTAGGRCLSGLRKRQRVSTERAAPAGENRGASATGGHRV
jgi:hypothetical protein